MGGMLIFRHHFPHVIPNSMQALRAPSYLEITFQRASFPCQHVSYASADDKTALPKANLPIDSCNG